MLFPKVTIVGVGLIGGSLGLALKARGLAQSVVGVARTRSTLSRALQRGAIDRAEMEVRPAVAQADLVYLAPPVGSVVPLIRDLHPHLKRGALVTDAASVKGVIATGAASLAWGDAGFIGGHPMAGSERSGVDAADADLFVGAAYILTPTGLASPEALERLQTWVAALGSRVLIMEPGAHDRAVALVSHLPHLLALALMQATQGREAEGEAALEVAAGSFRDATRVAMSDPALWAEIATMNQGALLDTCREFEGRLRRLREAVRQNDHLALQRWFEEARAARRRWEATAGLPPDRAAAAGE